MWQLSCSQRYAESLVTTRRWHFLPKSSSHWYPLPCMWAGTQHSSQENTPCSLSPLERGLEHGIPDAGCRARDAGTVRAPDCPRAGGISCQYLAPGNTQPGTQRARCHGPRGHYNPDRPEHTRPGPAPGARYGQGDTSRAPGTDLRAFAYHQAWRNGARPVHCTGDHGRAWGAGDCAECRGPGHDLYPDATPGGPAFSTLV